MSNSQTVEEPLDLIQAARDELIQGLEHGRLAPQSPEPLGQLEAAQRKPCRRCDSDHRELLDQSERLSVRQNGLSPR